MSEKILKELNDDFIRRMRNWIKARDGAPLPGPGGIYELGVGVDRYREARQPLIFGEAKDTNDAWKKLPGRYKQSVLQFWLYEGRPIAWHARRRRIDRETFEVWVMKGHELLKEILAKQADKWRRHHGSWRDAGAGT